MSRWQYREGATDAPRRTRWRLRLFLYSLLAATIFAGAVMAYSSSAFRVQTVEVVAPTQFDPAELVVLVDLKGESMFTVPLAEAEAILEERPNVRDARVERRWPNAIRLTIEPRLPWGYWRAHDISYVIDIEGVIISIGSTIGPAPTIVQTDGPGGLAPGIRVDADAVNTVAALMELVPQKFGVNALYYEYNRAEGLSLITDGGYGVVIGDGQSLDYKLAVWQAMEETLGRQRLQGQVLDLRFGDKPALRRR